MKATLISLTKPSNDLFNLGHKTLTDLIAYCARISNPDNQNNIETSQKLINYLIKNKHFSPLEMVNVVVEIETTVDISIQVLRHRSFSFQQFSQRYADPTKSLGFLKLNELREYRIQDPKNRQKSISVDRSLCNVDTLKKILEWEEIQRKQITDTIERYNRAIEIGVAKEQARALLPVGLIKTRMYMNGTMRSWLHYLQLRLDNGTQKEHIKLAKVICNAIQEIFNIKVFL